MLGTIQVGMNTTDLAASLRLYSEAFGFRSAGGQGLWGESIGIQELPPDSRALMWWMVGAQPFFQLELFHHTRPAQRRRPADWRACDLGWVRLGISVPDFRDTVCRIEANGLALMKSTVGPDGKWRGVLFDPYVCAFIEIVEAAGAAGPSVIYATSSVSDLGSARRLYGELLGFELAPLAELHVPADEALWGLSGASREGFLVRAGAVLLEIVRYDDPVGQPRRADYRTSDQGIVNVAFGSRNKATVVDALEKLRAGGVTATVGIDTDQMVAAYITGAEREIELAVIPPGTDATFGFKAATPFFG